MSLFDDIEREIDNGAEHGEGRFAYLNRSGRPAFSAIREKIDQLVLRYPEQHRPSLVARICGADDVAHESAMFELLLHEALICSGAQVEAIEPPLPHTDRSPDFLVRSAGGDRLYLEATLATGLSDKDRRAKRLLDAAIHAVNAVRTADFWLEVTFRGTPSQPPRLRHLRTSIERWLEALDYDVIAALWKDDGRRDERPTLNLADAGLEIALKPIPKTDRRDIGRAIGVQGGDVWSRTVGAALRQAIEGKSNRYGELDLPYVIAVNALDHNGEEHDVMAALIGQEVYRCHRGPDGIAHGAWDRDWNGVWITPDRGPRRQGVSGVLVFNELSTWAATKRRGLFVQNPWARLPIAASPLDVDQLIPEEGSFVRREGSVFSKLVDWEDAWRDDD